MLNIADFLQSHSNIINIKFPDFFYVASCLFLQIDGKTAAQIIPDNTLPNNSLVAPNGDIINITEGTTVGNNLFHSFEQFSLSIGQTALFQNDSNIVNIINRVTGSSVSNIDGLIRSLGTANLFLINPNGIIFGENASLDIGGSFIGSTANSIKFLDGSEFSAINPQEPPLLEVNIPIGLQYGSNGGNIVVEGVGNNLIVNQDFSIDRSNRPDGLKVADGQTLALVGKDIDVLGGNITSNGGNIELWAIDNGLLSLVDINGQLQVESEQEPLSYGNIKLNQAASVDASGNSGGSIELQGKNITVQDGSVILTDTLGNGSGGILNVRGTESIKVQGISTLSPIFSSILADVAPEATGNGGNVTIETNNLQITDGGQISSGTFGLGNGGTLTVKAQNIKISGGSLFGPSGLFTPVAPGATGSGGNLTIETLSLEITDAGLITSTTFGFGDSGDITIKADDIYLSGGNEFAASSISATVFKIPGIPEEVATVLGSGVGNGGNLIIETGTLQITDGAQIAVSTFGTGNAGNLAIKAENVELLSFNDLARSGLFASAIAENGEGGYITIISDRVTIQDGATISVSNFSSSGNAPPGQGKAGNISIEANSLKLDTSSEIPSSITASTNAGGGGAITLNIAEEITLNNNSQITAETLGSGNGGMISIITKDLNLNSMGQISTSSIGLGQAGNINISTAEAINSNQGSITATSTQSGGGNINLTTDFMFLENNSLISTSVLDSTGGGGNLTIDSNYVIAQDNSDLRANAVLGQGGNINILTEVILLSLDSEVDASSQFGLDGEVQIKSPESDKQIGVIQLQNTTTESTELLTANCALEQENTLIVIGKGGLSENPSQYLRTQSVWEDLRDFEQPTASVATNKIIEAQQWIVNERGNIELLSHLPFNKCQR